MSPWYDPMLAKVISFAPTRAEAARALSSGLARAQVHGITTNRDLLVRILRHPEFEAGATDTGFLVRHDPRELGAPIATDQAQLLHAAAAALAGQADRRSNTSSLGGLPSGWRNNPSEPQHERFSSTRGEIDVRYRFDRTRACVDLVASWARGDADDASAGGDAATGGVADRPVVHPEMLTASPTSVALRHLGVDLTYDIQIVGSEVYVDGPDGSSSFGRVPRFTLPGLLLIAGFLVAPLPGTIVRVGVAVGDRVETGETLVAIEAMKMEHEVRAGHAGVVAEVAVKPGDQVESGRLLVVLKED